jgi:hypothetical protein
MTPSRLPSKVHSNSVSFELSEDASDPPPPFTEAAPVADVVATLPVLIEGRVSADAAFRRLHLNTMSRPSRYALYTFQITLASFHNTTTVANASRAMGTYFCAKSSADSPIRS